MPDRSHERYCDAADAESGAFVELANVLDASARVPTCPDWTAADLIRHVGRVHRWVEAIVRTRSTAYLAPGAVDFQVPTETAGLPAWLAGGRAMLLEALRGVPGDQPVWAWGSDQYARFWSRRMLHETAIHRGDAEAALGRATLIASDVACDGIDEFLENFPRAVTFRPDIAKLVGNGETIKLAAVGGPSWTITLGPTGFSWARGGANATATVTATASDLDLALWGRLKPGDPRLALTGERAVLDHWFAHSAV
ncbi:MAG: maleylpyruvate isomerase family mycothiol-dependent enzyme [Chloroflexota bacterium]